jgi:ketosteroid isomerase-like protein
MNIPRIFKPFTVALVCLIILTQKTTAQDNIKSQLETVINDWYTSIGKGQIEHFSDLLTDDFQLLAFGNRFDKKQILEMVKDYADITYSLSNIREGAGENSAYITFDIEMKCNYKGKPTVGRAMETYLFKKANNKWKVNTKMIVMIEDKK